jgi:hypothetical protein
MRSHYPAADNQTGEHQRRRRQRLAFGQVLGVLVVVTMLLLELVQVFGALRCGCLGWRRRIRRGLLHLW